MLHVYAEAMAAGNRQPSAMPPPGDCAKTRPLPGAQPRTAPEKKCQKEEMAQWMLVWLENPRFPRWVEARRRVAEI